METIYFLGRVLPAGMNITIPNIPTGSWNEEFLELEMHFQIHIINGAVGVRCDLNRYDQSQLNSIYSHAIDLARAAINTTVFATGYGLSIVFDSIIRPDGSLRGFMTTNDKLPQYCTAFKVGTDNPEEQIEYREVLTIVMGEPPLLKCLDDLAVAIRLPHQAPANCARCMDGIRNILSPEESQRRLSWPLMQQTLNVSQEYLQFISNHSRGPRHGEHTSVSSADSAIVVQRSWIVMNRFIEFRKRGNLPLPLDEFPILTS